MIKDELVKLSKAYNTFTGLDDSMEGSVKFVMKTESIKKPKAIVHKEVKVEKEEKGFFNWIKGLFS